MGIPASQRLRKQSEFQKVRSSELCIHCGPFIVQCQPRVMDKKSSPKLGVIASRRVGNAVKRNRGKRLVREIFRRNADEVTPGSFFVVVLRSGFVRYNFAELQAHFLRACAKISERAGSREATL